MRFCLVLQQNAPVSHRLEKKGEKEEGGVSPSQLPNAAPAPASASPSIGATLPIAPQLADKAGPRRAVQETGIFTLTHQREPRRRPAVTPRPPRPPLLLAAPSSRGRVSRTTLRGGDPAALDAPQRKVLSGGVGGLFVSPS